MPWNKTGRNLGLAAFLVTTLALIVATLSAAGSGKLTIFLPQSNFAVDIFDVGGKEYADLSSVLQGLGQVAGALGETKYSLRFANVEAEFENGSSQARVGRNVVQLASPFVIQDRRGLVPLRSVAELLPHFIQQRVDYHEVSRRLYVGNAAGHFNVELINNGAALQFTFTSPVTPQISAEGGALRLQFLRDGITSAAENWKFESQLINSASYEETASGPQITVSAHEPLLASFANGGRVISIAAAPSPESATTAVPAPVTSAPAQSAATPAPAPPAASAANAGQAPIENQPSAAVSPAGAQSGPLGVNVPRAHYMILLDAGHGGEERGAALSEHLAEKDVTLALARRLRIELQNRGVSSFLLRDSDSTISPDQRAIAANGVHASLYIALHAGTLGRGVRIYTSVLAPQPPSAASSFIPWETAQAGYVVSSRKLAAAILDQFNKQNADVPAELLPAPVRPLNNISSPALAIEVPPQHSVAETLGDATYQQSLATALAAAIAGVKPQLGGTP